MTKKPRSPSPSSLTEATTRDLCLTPPYATDVLAEWLVQTRIKTIWEPAAGEDSIANRLRHHGFNVISTDIRGGTNFLTAPVPDGVEMIVTNPPYSTAARRAFVSRCEHVNLPWALLMPTEVVANAVEARTFSRLANDMCFIHMTPRVNFKMPQKGWGGAAQFPTSWYVWGIGMARISWVDISKSKAKFEALALAGREADYD